jgi:Zn-dependent peptidase ImmA (M78 family)/transcriptional regulator with XRE-family HTH domain
MDGEIFAKNIKRARIASGLKQEEIAQKAGLTRVAYLRIENGEAEPRSGNLLKIAKALNVQIAELFASPPSFKSLRFRISKNLTRKEINIREMEIFYLSRWLKNYMYLEDSLQGHKEYLLGILKAKSAQGAAQKSREILGLNNKEPINDLAGLLEKSGIKLCLHPSRFKSNFFGMSLSAHEGGPVIAVNIAELITIERQIFTAAHELGHLLLHPQSYDSEQMQENALEEHEADEFASFFLMPMEGFEKKWEETKGLHWIDQILHVKRVFKVSYLTVLRRLIFQRKADESIYKKFNLDYKRKYNHDLKKHFEPECLREPEGLVRADFMEDRLNRLVREALEKDIISLSKAAEILNKPFSEMHELARSWSN